MIAIVDYGAGNLFSVKNACDFLSLETVATSEATMLEAADGIILPGGGAFPDAMKMLHATGLVPIIKAQAKKKPLLGICLGMQILFDYGTEFEKCDGLGLIPGYVELLTCKKLKLPQIGWNSLTMHQPSPILADTQEGDYVYFVHSFGAVCDAQYILASTDYGCTVPALVGHKRVFGAQFHPEKSGDIGLGMLKAFDEILPTA